MLAHKAAVHHTASIPNSMASEGVTASLRNAETGFPAHSPARLARWTSITGVIARIPALSRSQVIMDAGDPGGASPKNRKKLTLNSAGITGAIIAAARNANVDLSRDSHGSDFATRRAPRNAAPTDTIYAGSTRAPRQPKKYRNSPNTRTWPHNRPRQPNTRINQAISAHR